MLCGQESKPCLPPSSVGFYPKQGAKQTNQEAQIRMIEESLDFAGVKEAKTVRWVGE
jgi:hypothetical protein